MDPFTGQSFTDSFMGGGFNTPNFVPTSNALLSAPKGPIHVRYHKQGSRALTLIEGLDHDLDQVRIAKAMKKAFSCSSTVQKDKGGNDLIQLQGDQRKTVKDWLLAQEILTAKEATERLVLHGY
jgi:translation initiation factor SUI1